MMAITAQGRTKKIKAMAGTNTMIMVAEPTADSESQPAHRSRMQKELGGELIRVNDGRASVLNEVAQILQLDGEIHVVDDDIFGHMQDDRCEV